MRKVRVSRIIAILTSILMLMMFLNRDKFFNININLIQLGLLLLIDIIGCLSIMKANIRAKEKMNKSRILILLCVAYMLFSKYVLQLPAEPYYVFYIGLLYIFLLSMATINFSKRDIRTIIDAYIVSSVIMGVLIIFLGKSPYGEYGVFRRALYYDARNFYDVNFTALYMLLATLMSFKIAINGPKKKKIRYLIATGINLIAIMFLGSRGSFVPMLIIMIFEFMRIKNVSFLKIGIALIFVIALFVFIPEDVAMRLFDLTGGNNTRMLDWGYGIDVFLQSPWFGNGMLVPQRLVTELTGMSRFTIHNTYIVYLAQMGILGALPFLFVLLSPLVYLWKGIRSSYLWICYCGILFAALMIEGCYTYALIIPVSIVYILISYEKKYSITDGFGDIFQF